jgi:RNA-directed DNA polymerase
MTTMPQKSTAAQLDFFTEGWLRDPRLDRTAPGGTGGGRPEGRQADTAADHTRALTADLLDRVLSPANLAEAYRRVRSNGGAPGIDGMTVEELGTWLARHRDELSAAVLAGRYRPRPVRAVDIPKPSGGTRRLGIPTVCDRLLQQAILQVLEPYLDPHFSASSFGFRPGRGTHAAVKQAQAHVRAGYTYVADIDLEKFFDRVNHDVLMARLARRVGDRRLLRLIRRFLTAGMMLDGVSSPRVQGTPQGSPLSPLLSNLLLDDLDKELERRGHRFVRYADDCNIYVQSRKAAERVTASIGRFLERRLKLRINADKSAAAPAADRQFLGYGLTSDGRLRVAPRSVDRLKERVRQITNRRRGVSFACVIGELATYLRGWTSYFRLIEAFDPLGLVDSWIRRRLRCLRLAQARTPAGIRRLLTGNGVHAVAARKTAGCGRGWWRLARLPAVHMGLGNRWLRQQGWINIRDRMQPVSHP